jgi:branched-chain amino acid transport system permease protein
MLLGQLLVNGLAVGGVYALIAVGFALIYNTTRMLHIAHGAVYTFGGYAFYVLVIGLGFYYWLGALLAVALGATLGVAIELLVYRPIRRWGGGPNSILIVSIGTVSILQAIYALVFTTDTMTLRAGALRGFEWGGVSITILHVVTVIIALVMFLSLTLFLGRSRIGIALRALSDNSALAEIQGLDTGRLYAIIFFVGSALAATAGVLISLDIGVQPNMGFDAVFIAFVAVIVGGVGYLPGALFGAFLVGFLQQFVVWKLDTAWQSGAVFLVLIVFLIFRPNGLFGLPVARRA